METGASLILDPACEYSRKRFIYRKSESIEIALMRAVVRPGDTVIDVGANLGYWTTALSMAVGPTGHVFSCEPVPQTFRLLTRNIELNRGHNVQAFPIALSDHEGCGRMAFDPSGTHRARLTSTSETAVQMKTIDTLMAAGVLPSFIKIDVEGDELAVLRGAVHTLRLATAIVVFEFTPSPDRAEQINDLRALAQACGYEIFDVPDHDMAWKVFHEPTQTYTGNVVMRRPSETTRR